jgi:hypothetical protein
MLERLNLYDILATIVPGTVLVTVVAALFPSVARPFHGIGFPDEFALVALLAAAMGAGLSVQTVGSMLEGRFFKLFGGMPSDLAFAGRLGDRYLPRDAATRIKATLQKRCGPTAKPRALFLHAMSIAESSADSKAAAFNAQYGQLRAVFTLFLLILVLLGSSRLWGAVAAWRATSFWTIEGLTALLTVLFAWRTWQRGAYYVREVLLTAQRLLAEPAVSSASPDGGAASQPSTER